MSDESQDSRLDFGIVLALFFPDTVNPPPLPPLPIIIYMPFGKALNIFDRGSPIILVYSSQKQNLNYIKNHRRTPDPILTTHHLWILL